MRLNTRFIVLLASALGLALLFHVLRLPGAWLFGSLAASAIFAVRGWCAIQFPNSVYFAGQAIIGTALGAGFSPKTLEVIPEHAGIFLFAVVFILLTSLLNGWLLSRFTALDPATSFLGTMPGGASAMAAMSDSLRADTRLVAAVQYVRLLIILASLACVAPILKAHAHGAAGFGVMIFYGSQFVSWKFGLLLLLAVVGWLAGTRTRIPAGAFLVPTVLYFLLGLRDIHPGGWPWPILATAYAVMGLQIGGRFHPQTIVMIRRVILPVVGNASAARRLGCARLLHFTTDASRFHQCLPRRHTRWPRLRCGGRHRPPCGHNHRGQHASRPSLVRAAFRAMAGAPLYARLATTSNPSASPAEGLFSISAG